MPKFFKLLGMEHISKLLPAVLAEIRNKNAEPGQHTGSAKAVHRDGSGGSCAGHQENEQQSKSYAEREVCEFHQTASGYMSGRSS